MPVIFPVLFAASQILFYFRQHVVVRICILSGESHQEHASMPVEGQALSRIVCVFTALSRLQSVVEEYAVLIFALTVIMTVMYSSLGRGLDMNNNTLYASTFANVFSSLLQQLWFAEIAEKKLAPD